MTTWATPAQIQSAAETLVRGELVAFATETVYGLGADASNPEAVAKIFAAKGRPSDHPVIVHVADAQAASVWVSEVSEFAQALMDAFWPGPLTLILPKADWVPSQVSGGQSTIGVRCPSHPVAQALLTEFSEQLIQVRGAENVRAVGIAAPSANRYGQVSPTQAAHVEQEFAELVAAGMPILAGGDSEFGIESTIVDLSRMDQGGSPALLRPGSLGRAVIEEVLGQPVLGQDAQAPRVPGSVKAHYAPRTPMRLWDAQALPQAIEGWLKQYGTGQLAVVASAVECEHLQAVLGSQSRVQCFAMPNHPQAYAQVLYAQLRALDALQMTTIYWANVPATEDWLAIRDRLQRAGAAFETEQSI